METSKYWTDHLTWLQPGPVKWQRSVQANALNTSRGSAHCPAISTYATRTLGVVAIPSGVAVGIIQKPRSCIAPCAEPSASERVFRVSFQLDYLAVRHFGKHATPPEAHSQLVAMVSTRVVPHQAGGCGQGCPLAATLVAASAAPAADDLVKNSRRLNLRLMITKTFTALFR